MTVHFRSLFLAGCCMAAMFTARAQESVTMEWYREINGGLTGSDKALDVLTDQSGNIYVTGISYQTSNKGQFATVMYLSNGDTAWTYFHTGASPTKVNIGRRLALSSDGAVYATGTISDGAGDIGVIKFTSDGLQWAESYAPVGFGSYSDDGLDIAVDGAGKVYVIGRVTSTAGSLDDAYTLRLNASGGVEWSHQFSENSATDYPAAIGVTTDGDLFALTSSYNFWGSATHDISTIHYDAAGTQQWVSRYNGSGDDLDLATDILVRDPHWQYITGTITGAEGDMDYVAMLQNEYGTRLWTDVYSGTAGMDDTAYAIAYMPDGAAIIIGRSMELIDGNIVAAATTRYIRTDGTLAWSDSYIGTDAAGAAAYHVKADSAGGIYVAGYAERIDGQTDALLLKYDSTGAIVWEQYFDGPAHMDDVFRAIALDSLMHIYASGAMGATTDDAGMLTVKYAQSLQDPGDTTVAVNNMPALNKLMVFPNPARSVLHVQLPHTISLSGNACEIYVMDQLGRSYPVEASWNANNRIELSVHTLPAGLYQLILTTQEGSFAAEFMHIR